MTDTTPDAFRFGSIDDALASRLKQTFGSPCYFMDEVGVQRRFEEFQTVTRSQYEGSCVAVSFKTNPSMSLHHELFRRGSLIEVISSVEYNLAKGMGVPGSKIVFNGPAKTDEMLGTALRDACVLNCDHFGEMERIESIARDQGRVAGIGLRLYFPGMGAWKRFGFEADIRDPDSSFLEMIRRIQQSPFLEIDGYHAHLGTNIRDWQPFAQLAKAMSETATYLREKFGIEPGWLSVGGGLAGGAAEKAEGRHAPHALPSIEDYASRVIHPLLPFLNQCNRQPRLIFEPGRTLFNSFGALLATVIGTRPPDSNGVYDVILDAGITSLAFAHKYHLPVHDCRRRNRTQRTRLVGPTCMENDVITDPVLLPALEPGDLLLIGGTGCYSMALANSFTHLQPGIVGWGAGDLFRWLRYPEQIADRHAQHPLDATWQSMQTDTARDPCQSTDG